jgi:hypothetical protein
MVFNSVFKVLIWVMYLLRYTTCYITQNVFTGSVGNVAHSFQCTYQHVSPCCSQLFLAYFHFGIMFAIAHFTSACLLNFSKKLCFQWA